MRAFFLEMKRSIEININAITNILIVVVVVTFLISQWSESVSSWLKESNLWTLLAITFFMFILKMLVTIDQRLKREYFNILPDQTSSNKDVEDFIKYYKPKRVDIFAYSSFTVNPIILRLLKIKHCNIRLLVANPSLFPKSEYDLHKNRQDTSLQNIKLELESIKGSGGELCNLKIRMYNLNPSIRGINFDNTLLSIGWYLSTITTQCDGVILRGHCNPLIHLRKTENAHLFEMFNKYFDNLWKTAKPYNILQ